jgi:hypothetical protein
METTIRIDTAAHCVADLAAAYARGESPLHHSAVIANVGEINCHDRLDVIVQNAKASMGGVLEGCFVLLVCDSHGPRESYDLDARGLTRRHVAEIKAVRS